MPDEVALAEPEPEPSWRPDPAEAEKTILAAFTRWVEAEHGLELRSLFTMSGLSRGGP